MHFQEDDATRDAVETIHVYEYGNQHRTHLSELGAQPELDLGHGFRRSTEDRQGI